MTEEVADLPNIACVILAGGRSQRYGADKALAEINGERLIDIIVKRLEAQTSGTIAINFREEMDQSIGERPILTDRLTGDIGPLAGLHAALTWARDLGYAMVITTPVDTPLLPNSFIANLMESGRPAIASYNGHLQPLHGIWLSSQADQLEQKITTGMRAARDWAEACGARECVFAVDGAMDPFININRPEDLLKLGWK